MWGLRRLHRSLIYQMSDSPNRPRSNACPSLASRIYNTDVGCFGLVVITTQHRRIISQPAHPSEERTKLFFFSYPAWVLVFSLPPPQSSVHVAAFCSSPHSPPPPPFSLSKPVPSLFSVPIAFHASPPPAQTSPIHRPPPAISQKASFSYLLVRAKERGGHPHGKHQSSAVLLASSLLTNGQHNPATRSPPSAGGLLCRFPVSLVIKFLSSCRVTSIKQRRQRPGPHLHVAHPRPTTSTQLPSAPTFLS